MRRDQNRKSRGSSHDGVNAINKWRRADDIGYRTPSGGSSLRWTSSPSWKFSILFLPVPRLGQARGKEKRAHDGDRRSASERADSSFPSTIARSGRLAAA